MAGSLRCNVPSGTGGFHPLLDSRGRLFQALVAQFLILDTRHLNVDVNAVEQGARDAFLVLGNDTRGAGAGFDWVSEKAARSGVQLNKTARGKA